LLRSRLCWGPVERPIAEISDMPLYEYKCDKCGVTFEKRQKVGASAPPCPTIDEGSEQPCSGEVSKQITNSTFVLKGGGWYKDGY